jgi:glycosyltransferase involved in cell wall biosynthesis
VKPLVSIVTPFYNTREFLSECIESVLRQTYSHWEYLLVNNCSSDGSDDIAREYQSKYPDKIKVINADTFRPQIANFNYALSLSSSASKYCKMVLADDWLYPECIEKLVDVAESDDSIGIVSSFRLKGDRVLGDGLSPSQTIFRGRDVCRLHLLGRVFLFGTPTTVLYRSEMIADNHPFFDENALHDDTDACYRILRQWNFGYVHQVMSFTRVHSKSLMGRTTDYRPELLDNFLQVVKFGPQYLTSTEYRSRIRSLEKQYYRFLAVALIRRKERELWEYHLAGLKSGGIRFRRMALLRQMLLLVLGALLNPGRSLGFILKMLPVSRKELSLLQ